jgi:hypothetical protein
LDKNSESWIQTIIKNNKEYLSEILTLNIKWLINERIKYRKVMENSMKN